MFMIGITHLPVVQTAWRQMVGRCMNWKECERKRAWLHLRYDRGIYPEQHRSCLS